MRSKHVCLLCLTSVFVFELSTAAFGTTWYVNGVSGNNSNSCLSATNACKTIRHAISLAASADTIVVAAATYKENLVIGKSLRLMGSGSSTTIIDGAGANTVVTVSSTTAIVTASNFTIRHGLAVNGAGVNNAGTMSINDSVISGNVAQSSTTFSRGGGVYNHGHLALNSTVVTDNSANSDGGGIFNTARMVITKSTISNNTTMGDGGGLWNLGTLTINASTISGNTGGAILFSTGGGIANSATMSIINSTISGNTVSLHGIGGIENLQGALTISSSTISQNAGGIAVNLGTTTLQNTVVANNASGNCFGTITSNGYNLSSDGSCPFTSTGDLNNANPMLGSLQNNGGPTQTMALLPGSPAIDAGNPAGCSDGAGHLLKTDQRGRPRPDFEETLGCDMSAYEFQAACLGLGSTCSSPFQCCSRFCSTTTHTCCGMMGAQCTNNLQCCGGNCVSGRCN